MMDQPTFIRSATERIPYYPYIPENPNRVQQFESNTYKYTIVVAGETGKGKDSVISSFDPSLKVNNKVKIGNGIDSCTAEFQHVEFQNEHLIGRNKGFVLNTVGLGDTKLKFQDHEIVTEIFSEILQNVSVYSGGVDAFFFVQSLSDTPINSIEKTILYMQAALGDDIFKSSIIIATKGNKISDPDELETNMSALVALAAKYNIKGGVIDYRCPYEQFHAGIRKQKTPITQEELHIMQRDLNLRCLKGLDFFNLRPLLNQLQTEIQRIQRQVKNDCKTVEIRNVLVKKTERRLLTLYLWEHDIECYDQVYVNVFTKTDPAILEEAKELALEKRINQMKVLLASLKTE